MLRVRFFASVREQLDCASLDLAWEQGLADITSLEQRLVAERGDRWREVLGQENLIRAVNQHVVSADCSLNDGDEVAFFPPVTGG